MAISQIGTSVTLVQSGINKGFAAVSLTNLTTSAESVVASGSTFEILGAVFLAASDTTPQGSTWTSITTGAVAYITATPAGTAGSQTITLKYDSTAPTWRDDSQGWYSSAASSIRYIASVRKSNTSSYEGALIIRPNSQSGIFNEKVLTIGDWDMNATTSVTVAHALHPDQIVHQSGIVRSDSGNTRFPIGHGESHGDLNFQETDATNITIERLSASVFDSVLYDSTSYNRGWVYIVYQP